MLFDTNLSAAVKCIHCGNLYVKDISLFDLFKNGEYQINCECGKPMFRIKSSDCKTFRIYIPCIACDKEHMFLITSRQVLSEKVKILDCPASTVELAFVGNKTLVREVASKYQKDLQELIEVLGI